MSQTQSQTKEMEKQENRSQAASQAPKQLSQVAETDEASTTTTGNHTRFQDSSQESCDWATDSQASTAGQTQSQRVVTPLSSQEEEEDEAQKVPREELFLTQ